MTRTDQEHLTFPIAEGVTLEGMYLATAPGQPPEFGGRLTLPPDENNRILEAAIAALHDAEPFYGLVRLSIPLRGPAMEICFTPAAEAAVLDALRRSA